MTARWTRTLGRLMLAGGGLQLLCGLLFLALGMPDPMPAPIMMGFSSLWLTAQLGLLAGLAGLFALGVPGRRGRWLLLLPALGALAYIVAEALIIVSGGNEEAGIPLLPIGALLTALGMTVVGLATLAARRWAGWRRVAPLLVGLYPFVAMFPFVLLTGGPNPAAIVLWGLPWMLLGQALQSAAPTLAPSAPGLVERRLAGTSR